MNTVSVEVPASLHAAVGEFAKASGMTVDQLVASALAEKFSALGGLEWLSARAAKGDRKQFEAALDQIADIEPEERDRI